MTKIYPAKKYNFIDDLWIISCYFNPNSYQTKPNNFEKFIRRIEKAKLNYLIVECVFGKQKYSLPKSSKIVRVRTNGVMWQKERLLNIALRNLPKECKKIAWLDCDVLFENPDWAKETSMKLNTHKVIQPFKEVIRLPRKKEYYTGIGEKYLSFGFIMKNNPLIVTQARFDKHGHTGFAWAAQRSIFDKYGFYDACIAGSGDHMMAHSFVGNWETRCVGTIIGRNQNFYNHYINWSKRIYRAIRSRVGYVEGTLLHLWHGDLGDRNYVSRQKALETFNYNPLTDLKLNKDQCWNWSHDNKKLMKWGKCYFSLRKEDG